MSLLVGSRRALLGGVGAPPSYADIGSVSNTSGNATVTIPVPTGGDLFIATIGYTGNGTITGPAGWTLIKTTPQSTSRSVSTWWKSRAASEPASYDWTLGSAVTNIGVMISLAGPSGAPEANDGQGNALTSVTAPSITTLGPNRLLVYSGVANSQAISAPSGMTQRYSVANGAIAVQVATEVAAQSGATGTRSGSIGGNANNAANLAAFRRG